MQRHAAPERPKRCADHTRSEYPPCHRHEVSLPCPRPDIHHLSDVEPGAKVPEGRGTGTEPVSSLVWWGGRRGRERVPACRRLRQGRKPRSGFSTGGSVLGGTGDDSATDVVGPAGVEGGAEAGAGSVGRVGGVGSNGAEPEPDLVREPGSVASVSDGGRSRAGTSPRDVGGSSSNGGGS